MDGCAAINCSNSSYSKVASKKRRVFRFPSDQKRRQQWIQNCRRDKWIPSKSAVLCEDHFEDTQFESNRADGWRKLKPNAIPTIFDVPNPPKLLECQRIKGIGMPKDKVRNCS
ncbi:hypothetical protein JTE90_019407 [Oedothorax gibbosus]|uniref:THAP-type domain-containing protein n=1 Tax=Oedothorax gibbosus TaxID=931172 RepID=A0AAV6TVX3_9ARAC|nr:hypothetical protein JTE90_019407 [Oedothorax gibbosus]